MAAIDALADPLGDVTGAEAEVAADTEAGWAVAAVAPSVDGGDGDAEVVGEVLDGEESVESVHCSHCGRCPLSPRCPQPCHGPCQEPSNCRERLRSGAMAVGADNPSAAGLATGSALG